MRQRRRHILVLALFALFALAVLSKAGSFLIVDAPRNSDTIIVLAGETAKRPALAESLLERGFARHVVLDVPTNATIYNVSELKIARQYTDSLPRGGDWSICPIAGLSTRDEVREALACVNQLASGDHSILMVTSDYHTRRAFSVLKEQAQGREVSIAAAYDSQQFGTRWWTHRQWAKVCFDEWLRLAWWQLVDRWR